MLLLYSPNISRLHYHTINAHDSFSLSETTYGRAVVEVQICAAPGRDSLEKEKQNFIQLPTTLHPSRESVLMSACKDSSGAPVPFQFKTKKRKGTVWQICAS